MLDPVRLLDHFAEQARWCEALGSPFTAQLLTRFAEEFEAGGPVRDICGDWPTNPRKDALALRLAGCLHHAVLTGAAPDLAAEYPAARADWTMARAWPLARAFLADNIEHARAFLASPPQTNETRRAIMLLPGLLELAARFGRPLRLLELGASAGLNLNWDRFAYDAGVWSRSGTSGVRVTTDWSGPPPAHLGARPVVASRDACDLSPVDLADPAAVARLKCYTWPDQEERLSRLDAAVALARETGVEVERAEAGDWLEDRLAAPVQGRLTVVYHSVFLIYPPREAIARIRGLIEHAGARATKDAPFAWLCYESEALFGGDRSSPRMQARLQAWPGGEARVYAESDGHVTKVAAFGG